VIRKLTAIVEREGDGFVAISPEVDVASQGDTIEQARANLQEALGLFFKTASEAEIAERLHGAEARRGEGPPMGGGPVRQGPAW
jgi:predicted RNase H-like HicB family nuclease